MIRYFRPFLPFVFFAATAFGQSTVPVLDDKGAGQVRLSAKPVWRAVNSFPDAFFPSASPSSQGISFVPTYEEFLDQQASLERAMPVLLNSTVVAMYGKPGSRAMGLLGRYSIPDLIPVMEGFNAEYDKVNGDKGVTGAFYLIFGTCWPEGEIGYLRESVIMPYIEYAQNHGMLVFLDHQIGKYPVAEAMRRLLPYMKYPNVHLALDPEWRTLSPMKEIGTISAAELNAAQDMMSRYLAEIGGSERKMLVVHQFNAKMISERETVRADFRQVDLVHCADGFGVPALKKKTYEYNAIARNIPLKSFKLFLKPAIANAGWDQPVLTPAEVMALDPEPRLVMYQ